MKRLLPPLLPACVLLIQGCASLPDAHTERLGEQRVEYALSGQGTPVVVFENGLGGTMDWWAKVFPEVAKDTTAFAYNRPDYGDSAPATTPRDGDHVVAELRTALRDLGLRPPYVLVGHSLGGLYMQLYARRYPDELAALVLVDSTHPDQLKGAGAKENWPAWARAGFNLLATNTAQAELAGVNATGAVVLALPPPATKPVIILAALRPMENHTALADDANAKRRDLARLYPGAEVRWVDSGHGIPLDAPDAVIAAIRDVLRLVRVAAAPTGASVVP